MINKNVQFSAELFKLDLEEPAVGVQFYKNGIIYLLDTKRFYKKIRASFGVLDTYHSQLKNNTLGRPFYFTSKFAFPYPTESTSFTSDYSRMYFTKRSGFLDSNYDNIKIFEAKANPPILGKSEYSEDFIELPFNGEDYSCIQPSVSGDGKIMIFASDMPGGYGKFDLYIVKNENGVWSEPVNLGSSINTPGNENFPSLIEPGIIYFASDGHIGFGDYDIYYSIYKDKKWITATNLGEPINSTGTDIAFTVSKEDNGLALFSSNRNLYKKKFQVFYAILKTGNQYLVGDYISESEDAFKEIIVEKPVKKEVVQEKDNAIVPVKEVKEVPEVKEDLIEFRIQISSSQKSLASSTVKVNGENYSVGEYFYKGAYRQTVGNFNDFAQATEFQRKCRASGHNGAFVVAFKNNERTLDKNVFVKKPATAKPIVTATPTKQVAPENRPAPKTIEIDNSINYRVQILSSGKSMGTFDVTIEGKKYPCFEYYYMDLYRYTIGRFTTAKEALNLHSKLKNTKYSQAFIVKFRGNERLVK